MPSAAGWRNCSESTLACVGVKAKTGEGVGEVGREEVIMAQAVVLLESCSS